MAELFANPSPEYNTKGARKWSEQAASAADTGGGDGEQGGGGWPADEGGGLPVRNANAAALRAAHDDVLAKARTHRIAASAQTMQLTHVVWVQLDASVSAVDASLKETLAAYAEQVAKCARDNGLLRLLISPRPSSLGSRRR